MYADATDDATVLMHGSLCTQAHERVSDSAEKEIRQNTFKVQCNITTKKTDSKEI